MILKIATLNTAGTIIFNKSVAPGTYFLEILDANGTGSSRTRSTILFDPGGNNGLQLQTINDPSAPVNLVNLSIAPAAGTEADATGFTITATADSAVMGAQTVDLELGGAAVAADFTGAIPGQITIADGQTTGFVTVAVNDDPDDEPDTETATFTISNPTAGLTLGGTTSVDVSIADNDDPPVNNPVDVVVNPNAEGLIGEGLIFDTSPAGVDNEVIGSLAGDVLTLGTDAFFDNLVGFYQVADTNGGIDTDGDGAADLNPGDAGYA